MSTYYMVAVYWPGQGYGGATICDSLEHAQAKAEKDKKSGYGRKKNPIHIIKRTKDEVIEVHDKENDHAP